MSEALIRKQLDRTLAVTSLSELVRVKTGSDNWLLLDTSGSMSETMRNGKQKIDGLREAVAGIRKEASPRMIAFDGREGARLVDAVPYPGGGTPLGQAIDFAKQQGAAKLVVISDGWPDNKQHALDSAKSFGGRIDIIFVGNPGDAGEQFLKELAMSTGGTSFTGDLSKPKELSKGVLGLLMEGEIEDDE